jgi:hypothetical protein
LGGGIPPRLNCLWLKFFFRAGAGGGHGKKSKTKIQIKMQKMRRLCPTRPTQAAGFTPLKFSEKQILPLDLGNMI